MNNIKTADRNNEDEIDLLALANYLYKGKWLIIVLAILSTFIAVIYAFGKQDLYNVNALLQIESKRPNLSSLSTIGLLDTDTKSNTEKEILLSRSVINVVVKDLGLDINIEPKLLPLPIRALAKLTGGSAFGLSNLFYARGYTDNDARLIIRNFKIPKQQYDKKFALTTDGTTFSLTLEDAPILSGKVGMPATANNYYLLIHSTNVSKPTTFYISRTRLLDAVSNLQKTLHADTVGKNSDSLLNLSYKSHNPDMAVNIVDKIATTYVHQNILRAGADIEGSLNFLKVKLPEVKDNLEKSEHLLNEFRISHGSINISAEAQALLDQVVEVEKKISEMQMDRSRIRSQFTPNHPNYKAWQQQRAQLHQRRDQLQKLIGGLPKTQQDVIRLNRDVTVGNQVYLQMLSRIQELDVAYAGTIGNAFILDNAAAFLQPNKRLLIVIIGFAIGVMLGIGILLLKLILRKGINSDEQLQNLGLSVYAVVPFTKEQAKYSKTKEYLAPLSLSAPHDEATEAIRSLRTSLHFAMLEAKNNIVSITSPEPAVGKSFISTNLAILIAQTGAKVLLIDADMRRGRMHKALGVSNNLGFSAIIGKTASFDNAIIKAAGGVASLDVIPRGPMPPNPTELLMGKIFAEFLATVAANYDFVLIDTPPILAVADALIIGEYAGTNMLIVRSERTTLQEVRYAMSRFSNSGLAIKGAVLNAYNPDNTQYGYAYSYTYGADKKS